MTIVTGILETQTWIQSIKQSWPFNICLNKFLANITLKYVVYVSTKIKSHKYGHVSTLPDLILNCQKEIRKYFFLSLKLGRICLMKGFFSFFVTFFSFPIVFPITEEICQSSSREELRLSLNLRHSYFILFYFKISSVYVESQSNKIQD